MKLRDLLKPKPKTRAIQTRCVGHTPHNWITHIPLHNHEAELYTSIRQAIPLVDAALDKIVRLTGGFTVTCSDPALQEELDHFVRHVPVGATTRSLRQFIMAYLDSMLTYGNAVGEIILTPCGTKIKALYNASLADVHLHPGSNPLEAIICTKQADGSYRPVPFPNLVLFTPLSPPSGEICGVSLLRSLPFVATTLMKILQCTANNFERMGSLRYAITYRPEHSALERLQSAEIAENIAEQWANVMSQGNSGITDFIAVGDVDIKVIGADSQVLETEIPVRQMLEQMIAKLGIPPFMLGLHWSTTERMSTQQADLLTSELASYRHLLESVIVKICETHLRLRGSAAGITVEWENINLQDKLEEANVRLINAQAQHLEAEQEEQPRDN